MDVDPWLGLAEMRAVDHDGPIVMLNLLKFHEGGYDEYLEYASVVVPIIERLGGRILFMSDISAKAHPDDAPDWDHLVLVRYPSVEAFETMVNDPEYRAAHVHRAAAVERALLRMTTEVPLPDDLR